MVLLVGILYFGTSLLKEKELNNISENIKIETDQELKYVNISEITLQKPGYVAIREFTEGRVGQMIEVSKYLEAGVHKNVHIDVSYAEGNIEDAIALLYVDGGEEGFNPITSQIVMVKNTQPAARMIRSGEYIPIESLGALLQNFSEESSAEIAQEVVYTDQGFSPANVVISVGDTVRFVNSSSFGMWVATDEHPQHTILSTFDQFGIAENSETYDYTFDKAGEWGYHDHIDASKLGMVIVEQN